ncbi:MAG: hypothetical protein RL235_722 [Chlamydiota bacterium]|jgi:hypothetical protein
MKQWYYLSAFIFACLVVGLLATQRTIVINDKHSGRFGDGLLTYLHAKWFAKSRGISFLYRPFHLSNQLVLDDEEIPYLNKALRRELKLKPFFKASTKWRRIWSKIPLIPVQYVCPYFPEVGWELKHDRFGDMFGVDWHNPEFRAECLHMIAPKEPLQLVLPPRDAVSIALHIRLGGGFDLQDHRFVKAPLKFPPFDFYIGGLQYAAALFPDKPLFCQVFTDDEHPDRLIHRLKEALPPNVQITFASRGSENRHDANVIEDFHSLFHYDILIRPQSSFSIVPSLLNDFAVVYAPTDCVIGENENVTITKIEIQLNEKKCQDLR